MLSSPTLAVVGASVRGAAFSAARAGCRIIAADLFADADLRQLCPATRIEEYPGGLADWLAKAECDGWLYIGALENYPELVESMAEIRPLWGNAASVLRRVRNPLELQRVLSAAGHPFPETVAAPLSSSLPGRTEWLFKSYRGSSGTGVTHACPADQTGYWQQRISGNLGSAIFVGNQGKASLLGVTRQLVGESWTGAGEFEYCGSIGPWQLSSHGVEQLVELGHVLATEFQLIGLFGVDFMLVGDQVWTLEVNPRYTASIEILERSLGIDPITEHLAACGAAGGSLRNSPSNRVPSHSACQGKAVLYAKRSFTLDEAVQQWLMQQIGTSNSPQIADIPVAGTEFEIGQPILTLFAEADESARVVDRLRQRVVELEAVLYGSGKPVTLRI